jgi:hypothetical protein
LKNLAEVGPVWLARLRAAAAAQSALQPEAEAFAADEATREMLRAQVK